MTSQAQFPDTSPLYDKLSISEARDWCDSMPIHYPEGIYSFPEYDVSILIRRMYPKLNPTSATYELIVVESISVLLLPGQVIGYLRSTGDPDHYKLYLYSRITPKKLTKLKLYDARFNASKASFSFEKPTRKLRFNILSLVPKLNRLIKISSENPADKIPIGFYKIYPAIIGSPAYSPLFPLYF